MPVLPGYSLFVNQFLEAGFFDIVYYRQSTHLSLELICVVEYQSICTSDMDMALCKTAYRVFEFDAVINCDLGPT